MTPKNILRHELIGLEVIIAGSSDPTLTSLRGRVVDETQKTLKIEASGKRKIVPKDICTFRFKVDSGLVEVSGKALVGRPQ
ncbi:MAG TPA: ribonuclease P protein component 1, partial [Euryarchaeota archaeon]|nr:ribonuclease P protein component 1 [Euryarchaeota archaeon]